MPVWFCILFFLSRAYTRSKVDWLRQSVNHQQCQQLAAKNGFNKLFVVNVRSCVMVLFHHIFAPNIQHMRGEVLVLCHRMIQFELIWLNWLYPGFWRWYDLSGVMEWSGAGAPLWVFFSVVASIVPCLVREYSSVASIVVCHVKEYWTVASILRG